MGEHEHGPDSHVQQNRELSNGFQQRDWFSVCEGRNALTVFLKRHCIIWSKEVEIIA